MQKQKNNFCGLKVISPEELIDKNKNDFVIIGIKNNSKEVYNELISKGFPDKHIKFQKKVVKKFMLLV